MCRSFKIADKLPVKPKLPGVILTALLKKYWPGLYTLSNGEKRLALKWEDYERAESGGSMTDGDGSRFVPTCAQVVYTKFWVRLFLSSSLDGLSSHRANL